jgi:hypothetical protein
VQGGENKVAGLSGFERDLSCFVVAHFADQNHFRRLAQSCAQRGRKIFRVVTHFALVDSRILVRVQVLDGILNGDDVIMFGLVNDIDDRCQRGTFA